MLDEQPVFGKRSGPANLNTRETGEKAPQTFEDMLSTYQKIATHDLEMRRLLTSREAIKAYQEIGHGIGYDVRELTKLERQIQDRYSELSAKER